MWCTNCRRETAKEKYEFCREKTDWAFLGVAGLRAAFDSIRRVWWRFAL
jgi:hypothetical protein